MRKVIISHDVIFDERPKPTAPPEPRVDLSEFVWDGHPDTLPKGVTAVGDAWDPKQNSEQPPAAPSLAVNSNSNSLHVLYALYRTPF